jgi:hypothetical protein
LHVLSTPPAFVLSQDQTLQQNLLNKRPGNKNVAKGIHNPSTIKQTGRGIAIIGTGLSSTLLSSQRTTAHHQTEPQSAARPPGHSLYFTRRFRRVKSAFRNRIRQTKTHHSPRSS